MEEIIKILCVASLLSYVNAFILFGLNFIYRTKTTYQLGKISIIIFSIVFGLLIITIIIDT